MLIYGQTVVSSIYIKVKFTTFLRYKARGYNESDSFFFVKKSETKYIDFS